MSRELWFRHIYSENILAFIKEFPFIKKVTCTLDPIEFSFTTIKELKLILDGCSDLGILVGVEFGNQKRETIAELTKKINEMNRPFFSVFNIDSLSTYQPQHQGYFLEIFDEIPLIHDKNLKGFILDSKDETFAHKLNLPIGLSLSKDNTTCPPLFDFFTIKMGDYFESSYRNPDYKLIENYLQKIRSEK